MALRPGPAEIGAGHVSAKESIRCLANVSDGKSLSRFKKRIQKGKKTQLLTRQTWNDRIEISVFEQEIQDVSGFFGEKNQIFHEEYAENMHLLHIWNGLHSRDVAKEPHI
jgi:hypothetical protein